MTISHLNSMSALSQALTSLNRMTGYGENPTVTSATRIRSHSEHSKTSETAQIVKPLARIGASALSSAAGGGRFQLSQGQIWSDLATALTRAGKRYN